MLHITILETSVNEMMIMNWELSPTREEKDFWR
jgi:hypothetical protein